MRNILIFVTFWLMFIISNTAYASMTITFNLNGGSGTTPATKTCQPGRCTFDSGTHTKFYRHGYKFMGWNASRTATAGFGSINVPYSTINTNSTYYAIWQPCAAGYYKSTTAWASASCSLCGYGEYSYAAATSCSTCTNSRPANSSYLRANTSSTCEWQCNDGYYKNGSSCTACGPGNYCPAGSSAPTSCSSYRANTTTTTSYASSASQCLCNPGHYLNGSVCDECSPTTYKSSIGNGACTACPEPSESNKWISGFPASYYAGGSNLSILGRWITSWGTGKTNISECRVQTRYQNDAGRFIVEYTHYNTSNNRYDRNPQSILYEILNPGYYAKTRFNDGYCGTGYNSTNPRLYQEASSCPAGKWCPGYTSIPICNQTVDIYGNTLGEFASTDTLGLFDCPDNASCANGRITCNSGYYLDDNKCSKCVGVYTQSDAGSNSPLDCYLTTAPGKYVKTVGAGQEECPRGSYCPGGQVVYVGRYSTRPVTGGIYSCPTPNADNANINSGRGGTFESNGGFDRMNTGVQTIERCEALIWYTAPRGKYYEYNFYTQSTGRYDRLISAEDYGWYAVTPGYYLITKGGCGIYAYYQDVKECPVGSYCPGKNWVYCGPANQSEVHTDTFGLEQCPTGYPNSTAGSDYVTKCYSNTLSRPWTGKSICPVPTGCATSSCVSCSVAPCNYTAYSNEDGTADGIIRDGCAINNTNCTANVSSVAALPGYRVNGNYCSVCGFDTYSTGGTQTECTACPNGWRSPLGSTDAGDCGRILAYQPNGASSPTQIYLRSGAKKTSPSLAALIDGHVFYANMTPVTITQSGNMYVGYNNQTYRVYHDTQADGTFKITTTPNTTSFVFYMSAAGNFTVDWGDGNVETIIKTDTANKTYSHTYATPGEYSIGIGGIATNYNTSTVAAISFKNNTNLASIDGSLGAMFPTLESGDQPRFYSTFANCTSLGGTIPDNLFDGVHGQMVTWMFFELFYNCSKLTGEIPGTLFAGITGPGANNAFDSVFEGCTGLTGIGEGLLSGISGTVASNLFWDMFADCTGLRGNAVTFGNVTGGNGGSFYDMFENCTGLDGYSARNSDGTFLYNVSGIRGTNSNTYKGCTNLRDYADIPSGWK